MNDHSEWKSLISAYIDEELTPEEMDTVNNHLVDCPACQKYLKELKTLSCRIKSLNNQTLSPDLEQRLTNINSRTERSDTMDRTKTWPMLKTAIPALMIIVMIVIGIQTYSQRAIQARVSGATHYLVKETGQLGTEKQYEAYYQSSDYSLADRQRIASNDISKQHVDGNTHDTKIALKKKFTTQDQLKAASAPVTNEGLYSRTANRKIDSLTTTKSELSPFSAGQDKTQLALSGRIEQPALQEGSSVTWNDLAKIRTDETDAGNFQADTAYPQDRAGQYFGEVNYPYTKVQLEESNREQYDLINENDFLNVTDNPLSTFSIDVDTASYSNVRRFLNQNQLPPRDAVRIEEMINYFKYNYAQPSWGQPFSINLEHGICPWNPAHQIILVGLQGKQISERQTPPSNLVFLIDVSGSMESPDKLPLLKASLKMMVAQLRPEERVSMVVYAGSAGLVLDSTPGYHQGLIMNAIDNLQAGGSTAGGQGIQLAYQIAQKNFIKNGNNRVILATDGDFNVGVSSDAQLVQIIEDKRKSGIFLTVLGFGTGNLQDAKMEKLADKGNGNYFYIDSIHEGKKVLVDELGSTLITIAKDVKIQIEFNPNAVKAYRLIGYENRKLAKEDFNDDTKDAGELGAGHTSTALYEIVPAGSWENTAGHVDPLKYQKHVKAQRVFGNKNEMMTVKLRYKEPQSDTSKLITRVLKHPSNISGKTWFSSSDNLPFATAVAEFGMLLRQSKYSANASYQSVLQRVQNSADNDQNGYKQDFIGLVQKAAALDNRPRPNVPVYQPQNPVYPQYNQQGGYNQK